MEHLKTKAWMERRKLDVTTLSGLTGYSREAIYAFLRNETPSRPGRKAGKISPAVWQRFRMACAGVDAQLRSSRKFGW